MNTSDLTTPGLTHFGRSYPDHLLFRVNRGIPVFTALRECNALLHCVSKLSLEAAMKDGDNANACAWATHYLTQMAHALMEDVAEAIDSSGVARQ